MREPYYITEAKRVVKEHSYTTLDSDTGKPKSPENGGVILDAQTANAMVKVWDSLDEPKRVRIMQQNISFIRYADFAWKVVS